MPLSKTSLMWIDPQNKWIRDVIEKMSDAEVVIALKKLKKKNNNSVLHYDKLPSLTIRRLYLKLIIEDDLGEIYYSDSD